VYEKIDGSLAVCKHHLMSYVCELTAVSVLVQR
jgi:hypothetical protein